MSVSEYRVTMTHDGGTATIVVTASSAAAAVDYVVQAEGAPRRSARLVETRPLAFERVGTDNYAWRPVPGEQWGRVDDQPANVDVHTNPFAPDPQNPFTHHATQELEERRKNWAGPGMSVSEITAAMHSVNDVIEELDRRADVETAVELWERLCAVPFVRGETQGEYLYSTRLLSPDTSGRTIGEPCRMPNREELHALVLSDGEEALYPTHDVTESNGYHWTQDTSPWSYGLRLYPITLTLISCGDYHGSDVDAANNRALDGTPGVTVREPNTGGQGSVFNVSTTVVGEMSSFENATDPGDTDREPATRREDALMWLESLVEKMESLVDNVTYLDEEKHSEFIDELAEEAWSDHLEGDTRDALQDMAPEDGTTVWEDTLNNATDELKASIHATYFSFEDNEWNAESATSVVNGRHREAVAHVARTLFGWSV
jgi:hypothetical protein